MSDARRDGTPAPDAYAATYMKGAGRVLLRDKTVGRALVVILGLVTLWCGGGALATFLGALPKSSVGVALLLTLLTAFFALLTMTLTVVRVVVSEGRVEVQYGLWGPRVPVARIRRCRVVPYDWTRFGGWGIKRDVDGTWAYVLKADGDVVELCWTDDDGAEKTALFSATDPHAVVAAVEKARATHAGARIATDEARPEGARIAGDETAEHEAASEDGAAREQARR